MKTFEEYRNTVNEALMPAMRGIGSMPDKLEQSMVYSLEAGGKRLRPVMLLAACDMAGGSEKDALPFACAIEMIHTYSLIHDDLPAIDNDSLRRGKPTNHTVFGEAVAILAGDGLLNSAAELMARAAAEGNDMKGVRAMACVLNHAGVTGMIGGQSVDVLSEGKKPTESTVRYIHEHKTADLLEAAVEAGLILGGAGEEEIAAGRKFGLHLGLAFQITDDLLDVTGDAQVMGKSTGKDAGQDKMTWVALKGIQQAGEDAREQIRLALEALEKLPGDNGFFRELAESMVGRNY